MRPTARTAARLALATAATLLAACGGSDGPTGPNGNGQMGSHTGSVSGGVALNTSGVALYGANPMGEGASLGFALAMGSLDASEEFKDLVLIGRVNGAAPTPGTYPLVTAEGDAEQGDDQFGLYAFLVSPQGHDLMCSSAGGTLTVTAASGGRLKGTYTAPVNCIDLDDLTVEEFAATVQGSFDAVSANGRVATVGPRADGGVSFRRIR